MGLVEENRESKERSKVHLIAENRWLKVDTYPRACTNACGVALSAPRGSQQTKAGYLALAFMRVNKALFNSVCISYLLTHTCPRPQPRPWRLHLTGLQTSKCLPQTQTCICSTLLWVMSLESRRLRSIWIINEVATGTLQNWFDGQTKIIVTNQRISSSSLLSLATKHKWVTDERTGLVHWDTSLAVLDARPPVYAYFILVAGYTTSGTTVSYM